VRAFISYSAINKKWSSAVKSALSSVGFQGFLAHEDLQISDEWKASIIRELKKADVFVALLSKEFRESEYCSQEAGFIISRKKVLIIPLSIDGSMPYGFISHLQGVRVHNEDEISQEILNVLLRKRPRISIPEWIKQVADARSFRGAEAVVEPLVEHFPNFTKEEAVTFAKAALGNGQVWDASLCKTEYLPTFKKSNWKYLSKALRAEFAKKVESP
jgi:hypothetical protein